MRGRQMSFVLSFTLLSMCALMVQPVRALLLSSPAISRRLAIIGEDPLALEHAKANPSL